MAGRFETDAFMAIRRLRRHLTVWRIVAVAAVAAAVIVTLRETEVLPTGDHVARVYVEGVIVRDEAFLDMLADIERDPQVKALIVDITSPGGTFTGGEAVFRALRRVADEKPVVAVMGELATSGGYMTALGADRILAGTGTLTGSIGVIMQSANITGLLEKIGVTPEVIKSGSAKAVPNPVEELQPREREQLQDIIDEMHMRFVEMVAERRLLSIEQVQSVAGDGRVMTGSTAASVGLVDQVGDLSDARAWLDDVQNISSELPLLDWVLDEPYGFWPPSADAIGGLIFGKSVVSESLRLDGIQALWHPSIGDNR